MMRFADGLYKLYERKRGVKDDFMTLNLSNEKMEFLFIELGSLGVEQPLGICFRHSKLECLLDLVEVLSQQFSGGQWSNALQLQRFKGF